MICDYCKEEAKLVTGETVYPHRPDLFDKQMYKCDPCDAWVGCHPGTTNPLGRLANASLRRAKMNAHAVFDPIWKSGDMRRGSAYKLLADRLGIPRDDCHIGMFDVAQCEKVVEVCASLGIGK